MSAHLDAGGEIAADAVRPDAEATLAPPTAALPAGASLSPGAPATSDSAAAADAPRRGRPRLPGLDGFRALAITAVVTYHLNPAWLPGGFLGVDVFFVVSGFLITTLLVAEHHRTGRIDLGSFWLRRARRLVPALVLCVVCAVLLARVTEADLLVHIGRTAIGALTFSSNWVEIAAGSNYFDQTAPQLFANFWSLAVEEQFYLVWPFVTLALVALLRSGRLRATVAGAIGLGSALWMAIAYDPARPTRVYYGTDTHLAGLMAGAALAFAFAGAHRAGTTTAAWRAARRPILALSGAVLVILLWSADDSRALTFRGGFALASVAAATLILGCVDRPGRLRSVMETAPLRWVGQRSYGIYLWHWPVILLVGADYPTTPGAGNFVPTRLWAVIVTLAIADLSYRFLEQPVRRLGFTGAARRLREWAGAPVRAAWARPALATAAAAAVVGVVAIMLTAPAESSTARRLQANAALAPTVAPSAPTGRAAVSLGSFAMPSGDEMSAFGDSMMVGSIPALRYYFPGIAIDAKSNRRWSDGLTQVTGSLASVRRAVVLDFGTNAGVDTPTVESILSALGPKRMVVLVDVHGPWARAASDNSKLASIAAAHSNVVVAHWNAAVSGHPDQLQPDGVHPSLTGQHLYAKTIRAAFQQLAAAHHAPTAAPTVTATPSTSPSGVHR